MPGWARTECGPPGRGPPRENRGTGGADWMLAWKTAKRLVVFVIGVTVALVGVVFLVTPGPGIAAILLGLAILATEFLWAKQLLQHVKTRTRAAANAIGWSGRTISAPGSSSAVDQGSIPPEGGRNSPAHRANDPCRADPPSPEIRDDVPPVVPDGKPPLGPLDPLQQPPPRPPDKP